MTNKSLSSLILLLSWSIWVSAQSVRPELIKTASGATLVFNTTESFFAVELAAKQFDAQPTSDGYYKANARLVRLTNNSQKDLSPELDKRVAAPREVLQLQFRRDLDEEQFALQRPVRATRQEFITTPKGRLVLHWWFELPGSSADRGATQQHYVSTVCGHQVLSVSAPLLAGDTPEALREYLIGIMQSVRESNDPINVSDTKDLRSPTEK